MAVNFLPNGYGSTSGSGMTIRSPIVTTGATYFVDSVTGSNSNAGTDRKKPKATVAGALAVVSANDTIVVFAGHTETVTVTWTISAGRVKIRGEGSGTTRPQITPNFGGTALLNTSASGLVVDNLYIKAPLQAISYVFAFLGNWMTLSNCYVELNNLVGTGCYLPTAYNTIKNTTFVQAGSQQAIAGVTLGVTNDLLLDNVTFDGGALGFSSPALVSGGAVTGLTGIDLAFLNGADYSLASGTVGDLHIAQKSGSVAGTWTP